jgi:Asp-tRNA(Asn)/Glu-tRNA(Gln) amidotransferase A subunit family amidase
MLDTIIPRRHARALLPLGLAAICSTTPAHAQREASAPFDVFEATIPQLQTELASGRLTSVQLVDAYLARIAAYDSAGPRLNAILWLNPGARTEAEMLDRERATRGARGPLHGIPVLLKDNFNTFDMPTTAGSIALAEMRPTRDAFQVRRLREAGAIVLGKTNLHELASGITTISSLGGQTRNPYDPARNPGGSSGGTAAAIAASFAALGYGTDTCGSIRIPSSQQSLFGLRPTKGLSSIDGIVPLAHTQDVAGPLARSVIDLALGLDATAGFDERDSATHVLRQQPPPRFVAALDSTALHGARIGVLEPLFGDAADDQEALRIVRTALEEMKAQGAVIVPLPFPALDSLMQGTGVIDLEFKFDLADYLAAEPGALVRSVDDILRTGLYHASLEERLRRRNAPATRNSEAYRNALARRSALQRALNAEFEREHLDAMAYPTMRRKPAIIGEPQSGSTCALSAQSGFPALSAPAGFTDDALPIGIELLGRPWSDARLVAFAFDFEQATHHRKPPVTTPPLVAGHAPAPLQFAVITGSNVAGQSVGAEVRGDFTFDVTTGTLAFAVKVTGADPARLLEIALLRIPRGELAGPIIARLAGPGSANATGTLTLSMTDRQALLDERISLALFTRDDPAGAARVPLLRPR